MKAKIPFRIKYPIKIFDESNKINLNNKKLRKKIFKRSLFYYKSERIKNNFLEKRWRIYSNLAKEISKLINKDYPNLKILNISSFGSALYSENPNDFDFLVIVKGNKFSLIETKIKIFEKGKEREYSVGISIKGLNNLSLGILDLENNTPFEQQKQIIDRTVISLFRRHLPIMGKDFLENKRIFQENIFAQCFDLLINTYDLYYLKKEGLNLSEKQRAKKILSRLYEAISYLKFIEDSRITENLRKEVYNFYNNDTSFLESKTIFLKFKKFLEDKSKNLRYQIQREISFERDEKEFRGILKKTKSLILEKSIGTFLPVVAKISDKNGKVISLSKRIKGKRGPIHAEIAAINDAKRENKTDWENYTLYCSLEPCGECTKILSSLGIRKIVYCLADPLLSYYGRMTSQDEEILLYQHNSPKLIAEFQKIYSELYNKKLNLTNKTEILNVLANEKLRRNITQRLISYWKSINLPNSWIKPILKILLEYRENEDLAIKKIRKKFLGLVQKDSAEYSQKLIQWRKRKVKNLSEKLKGYISGEIIADVGGRSTDFADQILSLNKNIKKFYVTDIGLFSNELENKTIEFLVQSSKTTLPFKKNSVDTVILSMVVHHLKSSEQEKLIDNIISSLRKKGRIILIEDTYPEICDVKGRSKNIRDFLKLSQEEKRKILSFYDWFGNRLMRNRDQIDLVYNYKTMDEWKEFFEKRSMKEVFSEFVKKEKSTLALFPPKAIMIFEKTN